MSILLNLVEIIEMVGNELERSIKFEKERYISNFPKFFILIIWWEKMYFMYFVDPIQLGRDY